MGPLDPMQNNVTYEHKKWGDSGPEWLLKPNCLYLGATEEIVENNSNELVPMLEGRSSLARLGIQIHATAGFGDIGFCGRWTLEITVVHPTIIRPGLPIGQLYWIRTAPTTRRYKGKYANMNGPTECRLYEEYKMKLICWIFGHSPKAWYCNGREDCILYMCSRCNCKLGSEWMEIPWPKVPPRK